MDYNSLYPSIMIQNLMPCGDIIKKPFCDILNQPLVDLIENPFEETNMYIYDSPESILNLVNLSDKFLK